jgi:hypothetical protein
MFTWRVGNLPLDLTMVEPGAYRWVLHARQPMPYEAKRHGKKDWSLTHGGVIVQIGLASLRECIARSFDVPVSVVRNAQEG